MVEDYNRLHSQDMSVHRVVKQRAGHSAASSLQRTLPLLFGCVVLGAFCGPDGWAPILTTDQIRISILRGIKLLRVIWYGYRDQEAVGPQPG